MYFDSSIEQFSLNPFRFHLRLDGDTLFAVEGDPLHHEISHVVFETLKSMCATNPNARSIVGAIRELQSNDAINNIFSAIIIPPEPSLSDRILPHFLVSILNTWCEETIGSTEYERRLLAIRKIQVCYKEQSTELSLDSLGLTSLPNVFYFLKKVTHFSASHNHLTNLPASMEHLHDLQKLTLSSNQLAGVPDFVGKFPRLDYLSLSHNLLHELPATIFQSTSLREVEMINNILTNATLDRCERAPFLCVLYSAQDSSIGRTTGNGHYQSMSYSISEEETQALWESLSSNPSPTPEEEIELQQIF